MIVKLKHALKIIRGFFPIALPIGAASFTKFSEDLFSTYSVPNLPSYKSAIATAIMHLGHTKYFVTPFYFYLLVRKAQANEIAFAYLDEQRIEQGRKIRAEKQAAEDLRQAALLSQPLNDAGITDDVSVAQA